MKCKLRIYQKTRWCGSIFFYCYQIKELMNKKGFNGDAKCPIDLETIETYFQILTPAYFTTLGWEKILHQLLMLFCKCFF